MTSIRHHGNDEHAEDEREDDVPHDDLRHPSVAVGAGDVGRDDHGQKHEAPDRTDERACDLLYVVDEDREGDGTDDDSDGDELAHVLSLHD